MKLSRNVKGFTLIELLVAMLVFSLLAIAGYRGLQSVLDTRNHLDAETRKYQDLGQFFSRLEGQLAQASRRPAHLRDGREQSAFVGFASDASGLQDAQVLFTRGGGVDATGGWIAPQRVGYRLRNHAVELLRWDHLDQAPNAEPKIDVVLHGVREFELRYLSLSLVWEKQWAGSTSNVPLPKAVEVLLLLDSGEKLLRVMDLP
jgi:general secretion pathway protein J